MANRALVLLALGTLLAGCLAPLAPASTSDPIEDVLDRLRLREDGFEIEAPVHVMLIGFEPGTAAAVQAKLAPAKIEHEFLDFAVAFPPEPDDVTAATEGTVPMPVIPVANWIVHEASPALAADFFAAVAAAPIADGMYDGNLAEDWLAARLPAEGFPVDPATPALVVLHGGDALAADHGWRTTFPQGWLEPVRVFGERTPLLVFDTSAREDPYVTTTPVAAPGVATVTSVPVEREAYNYPLAGRGAAEAETLALLVTDATHFRLLQSSIYPVTSKPCHAVTLILAIRGYSLAEAIGVKAENYLDMELMQRAFDNLTGKGNTILDLKVLHLPQDDPALEAMIPRSSATLDAFRWYVDQNWEKYWVPHEGCEPYVSFIVSGDTVQQMGFSGIATYGVKDSHRISFSIVDDLRRLRTADASPLAGTPLADRHESIADFDMVHRLYLHETGHLMGQHHPHNVIRTDDGTPATPAFNAVWSVMSYQNRERVNDFGIVDQANFMRNRAGFVIQAAQHQGLQDTAEFAQATELLAQYRWQEAGDVLVPLLAEGHDEDCRRAPC